MLDIIWDQNYSVNIVEIDRQHQKLAAMLDLLFEEIERGKPGRVLAEIVEELKAYSGYHFDTEEKLLTRFNYPEYEAHKKEHDVFRVKVLEFKRDLQEKKETLPGDVLKFMTHWLTDHVINVDKKYAPFLKAHGIF